MFYDIYLDEVFYLGEDENVLNKNKGNVFMGLDNYSKQEINNFKNGKVIVLNKEKDLEKFVKTSRNILSNNEKLYYGKINEVTANKLLSVARFNLKGFNLSLQRHNFKHIEKKHCNLIHEIARKQCFITEYDFYLIPCIVSEFDYARVTHNNECNNKSLELVKEINNIIYHLIVYISFRNHNVEVKTFYKKKKRTLATVS